MAALFNANTVKRFNYLVLTEMYDVDHGEMQLTLRLGLPAMPSL